MSFKSVLVTGANRGLGLEFVRQLAAQENGPLHVFACCRDPAKASDLVELARGARKGVLVHLVTLDVTNDDQILEAVKYVWSVVGEDGLNMLINNAGILQTDGAKLPNVDRASLIRHFDVNAVSPLMIVQAFLPLLRKAAEHHLNGPMSIFHSGVVNISSGIGSISANTTGSAMTGYGYRLGKVALNMVTKCLAIDLKLDRILFVSVCPGWVQTDMGSRLAMLTPQQSISSMLKTFAQFSDEHSGGFFQRDGTLIAF